ncbi:MAG TPA: tol-pal system protein YbgF [Steroidobacteraceae bacterium]|nr:tol-pal system protein YbgF [Steroidobacteraceae bacterium]
MRAAIAAVPLLLVLAGCATTPEVDPVQLRLDDLDARVGRIDRIVANNSLVQLSQQIEAQQQELRQLRGRIEELQNENAKLRQEQRDLYGDLDRRLNEAKAVAATAPPPANPADEQVLYDRALEQLRGRDYAGAVDSLRSLAAAYPNGAMADNTQYWLGEAYYVTQEFGHAAAAFQRVLTDFPNSRKAPDALLKLAYTQLEQGNAAAGRANLQQVIDKYPGTESARLATDRLSKLPRR